jgi:cytochrome P450
MVTTARADLPQLAVTDPVFWGDPHAAVREARRRSPVACTPYGSLVLLRYDDCLQALADDRLVNDYDSLLTRNGITDGPLWDWWKLAMLNNNAPVHTRLRSLVSRAFTPRAVGRADALVRELTTATLAAASTRDGRIELVHELCEPMPLTIICDLIGVPRDDVPEFRRWVADLGLMFSERISADDRAKAEEAMVALGAYIDAHADRRRAARDRGDDLFAALVASSEDGDRLSRRELVAMVVNLLFGALDTTRGALSLMVALLVQRPELLDELRARPELVPYAVEELLRVEPPVGELSRVAREDLQICGVDVTAGSLVSMSVLAANRDPERFADPDAVVLRRFEVGECPSVLSFGRGVHHCLGSSLARLELRAALATLVESCRSIELDGDAPRYVPFLRVRCIERLPLVLTPRT